MIETKDILVDEKNYLNEYYKHRVLQNSVLGYIEQAFLPNDWRNESGINVFELMQKCNLN